MNQIIQESLNNKNKNLNKKEYNIEFSNAIAEIPYGGNLNISINNRSHFFKDFIVKRKYQLQFILSFSIALIFLVFLFWKLYQNQQQEKIAKELLNSYQLSTLYSNSGQYNADKSSFEAISKSPFVIGMIKINKINLSYPILSESNDDLLKISLCRFTGPMPNEVGNLCIAGHNYEDERFFGRLNELEIGDQIEIYGLFGQKQNYHVFKKYEVEASDLSCTDQNTENNKILTLLTCNNLNDKKRIVIKAK